MLRVGSLGCLDFFWVFGGFGCLGILGVCGFWGVLGFWSVLGFWVLGGFGGFGVLGFVTFYRLNVVCCELVYLFTVIYI